MQYNIINIIFYSQQWCIYIIRLITYVVPNLYPAFYIDPHFLKSSTLILNVIKSIHCGPSVTKIVSPNIKCQCRLMNG